MNASNRFTDFDVDAPDGPQTASAPTAPPRRIEVEGGDSLDPERQAHGMVVIEGHGVRKTADPDQQGLIVGGAPGLYAGDRLAVIGTSHMSYEGHDLEKGDGIADTDLACKLAGLDWEVTKEPVQAKNEKGEWITDENHFQIRRRDNDAVFGYVSNAWEPIQPKTAISLLADVIGEDKLRIDLLGEFKGGQIVFAQTVPDQFDFSLNGVTGLRQKHDYTGRFMITNGMGGNQSLRGIANVMDTGCWNYYLANMRKASLFRLTHTGDVTKKLSLMREALRGARADLELFQKLMTTWATTDVNEEHLLTFCEELVGGPDEDGDLTNGQLDKINELRDHYETADAAEPGRVLGLAQVGTYYQTHINAVKGGRDWDSVEGGALEYATIGAGASFTNNVMTAAQHVYVQVTGNELDWCPWG